MVKLIDRGVDIDVSGKVQQSEVRNRLDYQDQVRELVESGGVNLSPELKEDIKQVEALKVGGIKTCDYKAESAMLLSTLYKQGKKPEEIDREVKKLLVELKKTCSN